MPRRGASAPKVTPCAERFTRSHRVTRHGKSRRIPVGTPSYCCEPAVFSNCIKAKHVRAVPRCPRGLALYPYFFIVANASSTAFP
jgi:hypothetical protein